MDGTLLINSSCKEPVVEDEARDVELVKGDAVSPPLGKEGIADGSTGDAGFFFVYFSALCDPPSRATYRSAPLRRGHFRRSVVLLLWFEIGAFGRRVSSDLPIWLFL